MNNILLCVGFGVLAIIFFILFIDSRTKLKYNKPNCSQESAIQRRRLELVLNLVTEAVLAVDAEGYIKIYNSSAMWILDTNASPEAKKIADFVKIVDENNKKFDFLKYLQDNGDILAREDLRLIYPNGDFIKINFACAKTSGDKYVAAVLTMRDITREKSLNEERDEFISVVSHELRTPATVAEGTLSNIKFLLEKKADPSIMTDQVAAAYDQIVYLEQMVNDIGTLSRADRGVGFDLENIDVFSLVTEVASRHASEAAAKQLKFETKFDQNLGQIQTSRLYIQEILQNFINNAIKYTDKGTVTFAVTSDNDKVKFAVTDTGIGISRSDQKRIFEKFFRSEHFRTRKSSGIGLGLYVTAKLAKFINVQINIDSELGKGSTFSFEIPKVKEENANAAADIKEATVSSSAKN